MAQRSLSYPRPPEHSARVVYRCSSFVHCAFFLSFVNSRPHDHGSQK
ncbi:hypothetical protein E2C01_072433 [Portunus trituberculatus]|uniref:Uncharacterized protein n=1 Tax=Portunus trituberculatus TaxID=210409 RepID=A0A5B7I6N9_PORTR|nr:hypothetical protein [Portunus trituberculatus]